MISRKQVRNMEILWAPWRYSYVEKVSEARKKECVLCRICRDRQDAKNYIFRRTPLSYAVLNIYPFNGGHVLIIPNRHVADISDLTLEERTDLFDLLVRVKELMAAAFRPQAFNVGMNLGAQAGAGIPEHLHIHVVPRWDGDVNFMPVLFNTKVLPVALDKVYKVLKDADKKRHRKAGK